MRPRRRKWAAAVGRIQGLLSRIKRSKKEMETHEDFVFPVAQQGHIPHQLSAITERTEPVSPAKSPDGGEGVAWDGPLGPAPAFPPPVPPPNAARGVPFVLNSFSDDLVTPSEASALQDLEANFSSFGARTNPFEFDEMAYHLPGLSEANEFLSQPRKESEQQPGEEWDRYVPYPFSEWYFDEGALAVKGVTPRLPQKKLPSCTAGQNKPWILTDSQIMAYTAMRGSVELNSVDPLQAWIGVHEDYGTKPQTGEHASCVQVAQDFDKACAESLTSSMQRPDHVEIPRPNYQHIEPPADFDPSYYLEPHIEISGDLIEPNPYGINENEVSFEISDDEGDPWSGRISPCTFRLMAEGCRRWDADSKQVEMPKDTHRLRPATPEHPVVRPDPSRIPHNIKSQKDEETGEILTPTYAVPENPSIRYTPPGVRVHRYPGAKHWLNKFDRMDPVAAQKYRRLRDRLFPRNGVYPGAGSTEPPSTSHSSQEISSIKVFTDREVEEAIKDASPRIFGGTKPEHVHTVLGQRYQTIERWKTQELAFINEGEKSEQVVRELKAKLNKVRYCVGRIVRTKKKDKRQKTIRKHVAGHLEDLQHRLEDQQTARQYAEQKYYAMKHEIEKLESEIQEQCQRAGMRTVDEVYEAMEQIDPCFDQQSFDAPRIGYS